MIFQCQMSLMFLKLVEKKLHNERKGWHEGERQSNDLKRAVKKFPWNSAFSYSWLIIHKKRERKSD